MKAKDALGTPSCSVAIATDCFKRAIATRSFRSTERPVRPAAPCLGLDFLVAHLEVGRLQWLLHDATAVGEPAVDRGTAGPCCGGWSDATEGQRVSSDALRF